MSITNGYGRMAVGFLDPPGRGGKPSNIRGGICWLNKWIDINVLMLTDTDTKARSSWRDTGEEEEERGLEEPMRGGGGE